MLRAQIISRRSVVSYSKTSAGCCSYILAFVFHRCKDHSRRKSLFCCDQMVSRYSSYRYLENWNLVSWWNNNLDCSCSKPFDQQEASYAEQHLLVIYLRLLGRLSRSCCLWKPVGASWKVLGLVVGHERRPCRCETSGLFLLLCHSQIFLFDHPRMGWKTWSLQYLALEGLRLVSASCRGAFVDLPRIRCIVYHVLPSSGLQLGHPPKTIWSSSW